MRKPALHVAVFLLVLLATQLAVGMRASRTASVTGDEPFYLLTAQSLVSDGDLDLRDEYERPEREMSRFWDGRVPLWKQMTPAPDGRLVAPHDPGLSLLIAPAYAAGGLEAVQRFLAALWAVFAVAAFEVARRWGASSTAAAIASVAIGAGAPGIVYGSQVYPEAPAALLVALGLLLVAGRRPRPLLLALVLVALAWLGVKYVPLGALVFGAWAWRFRARPQSVAIVVGVGAVAAAHFAWWHVGVFGGLTPYSTNVVWAGEATASILAEHIDVTDRLYRLHGLFLDARFGVFRWSPIAMLAVVGIVRRTALHAGAVAVCVLMGTFASITIMGWWFPGRMLLAGFAGLVVLVATGVDRLWAWAAGRAVVTAAAVWSVAIGGFVAWGAHHRWIRLAVDPFELGFPLAPRWLFPDFRQIGAPEVMVTLVWFATLVGLVSVVQWRSSYSSTGTPSRTERSSRSRPIWRLLPGR